MIQAFHQNSKARHSLNDVDVNVLAMMGIPSGHQDGGTSGGGLMTSNLRKAA